MMKIKFKIKRGGVFRQLAAVFLPIAVISLCSCSQEEPVASVQEPTSENIENPITRSPQEAVAIAERAWQEFYGSDASASRSSSAPLIDLSRPVEVVRGIQSRGASDADTLMYVVNFTDDAGFAIVAAPRTEVTLLAITSQGHYYPESMPEEETIPGFELWFENTLAFFPDTLPTPIPGPGISPGDERLEVKEWEDTISRSEVGPQLMVTWGQGNGRSKNLNLYPEGYLFGNGWAGCSNAAIAQVCAFYQSPQSMLSTPFPDAKPLVLDWNKMSKHYKISSLTQQRGVCEDMDADTHTMIAEFCKAIASWTFATENTNSTSTPRGNVLPELRRLLPERTIENWQELKFLAKPGSGSVFLVCGEGELANHMWVCDGYKTFITEHILATRSNSTQSWNIVSQDRRVQDYLHYNWGWYGRYNGWFYNGMSVVYYDDSTKIHQYKNLRYARVK